MQHVQCNSWAGQNSTSTTTTTTNTAATFAIMNDYVENKNNLYLALQTNGKAAWSTEVDVLWNTLSLPYNTCVSPEHNDQ